MQSAMLRKLYSRKHSMATRSQTLSSVTSVLPFMSFPAEIRNAIYELSIELRGVESYFEKYYAKVKDSVDITVIGLPRRKMYCPTIFLLSMQVYCEAIGFLRTKGLVFQHGLLDVRTITHVCCPMLFRRISSLTITTTGHNVMAANLIRASWSGYMEIIVQLARILTLGHVLKTFDLELVDPGIVSHATVCWRHPQSKCDFRDGLMEATKSLEQVRGVGKVTITGLLAEVALQLKRRMESHPITFMHLPVAIRSKIYERALDWSDCTATINRHMRGWDVGIKPSFDFRRTTPTVLLLSRQITQEALAVLARKPLHLRLPSQSHQKGYYEIPSLTNYISPMTLQRVQHLVLDLKSWQWGHVLADLCATLAKGHSLKSFTLRLKDARKSQLLTNPTDVYPDIKLHMLLRDLTVLRSIDEVTFVGDLPSVYSAPLAMAMQSRPGATCLPYLVSVDGCGKPFYWA